MKPFTMLSLTIGATIMAAACGHDSSDNGRSTRTDSVNVQGKAPVEYGAGQPDVKVDTSLPRQTEAMKQQNAQNGANVRNSAQGNGMNTSNTTDKSTTTGSANNGDADKDRKK